MSQRSYRPRTEKHERRLAIRGIEHCVHEWGTQGNPLIVLLHGWGDCGATFQFLVDELRQPSFIVAPDWRGFGDSEHNAGAYWFPDYLADLDALLEHYSPDAPAVLVGHSMGGNVAALYAGVRPDRVAALVNAEGFGLPDSIPASAPENYRRWLRACRARRSHPGYADADALVEKIKAGSPALSDERARFVAACWARGTPRLHLKADMAHRWPNAVLYRRAEALACWREITAPTLLIYGKETAFADAAAAWQQDGSRPVPQAVVQGVPGAGHMLHFEQPAALAAAIEAFLGENVRGL